MRKEILEQMTDAELMEYAQAVGVKQTAMTKAKNKAKLIFDRWEKVVNINVYGYDFEVKTKVLKDKRFVDLVTKENATDDEMTEALLILIGEAQLQKLYELCTDEDGTVDIAAIGLAFVRLINSPELKN